MMLPPLLSRCKRCCSRWLWIWMLLLLSLLIFYTKNQSIHPLLSFVQRNSDEIDDDEQNANTTILEDKKKKQTIPSQQQQQSSKQSSIIDNKNDPLMKYAYRDETEMNARSYRFPSVSERVKVLMSSWYLPPCEQDQRNLNVVHYKHHNQLVWIQEINLHNTTKTQPSRIYYIDHAFDGTHTKQDAFDFVHALNRTRMQQQCQHRYCKDMIEYLFPALDRMQTTTTTAMAPILFQFGDNDRTKISNQSITTTDNPPKMMIIVNPHIPVMKKFRRSITSNELHQIATIDNNNTPCYRERMIRTRDDDDDGAHLQPIILKLKTRRHYQRIYQLHKYDIAWEQKKNIAIFRGELTGGFPRGYSVSDTSPYDRCQVFARCRLVLHYNSFASSSLIDAKLTSFDPNDSKQIPLYLPFKKNGKDFNASLYGDTKTLEEMLQYKALIMLEGNDVSSGLKWGLFSNSVVLMPPPTFTSWAMEELLQPFVHYIPLDNVEDDVQVKMQWVLDNDDAAQKIAHAGKLWISDLILHADAPSDEEKIYDEIVKRYQRHFRIRDSDQ